MNFLQDISAIFFAAYPHFFRGFKLYAWSGGDKLSRRLTGVCLQNNSKQKAAAAAFY